MSIPRPTTITAPTTPPGAPHEPDQPSDPSIAMPDSRPIPPEYPQLPLLTTILSSIPSVRNRRPHQALTSNELAPHKLSQAVGPSIILRPKDQTSLLNDHLQANPRLYPWPFPSFPMPRNNHVWTQPTNAFPRHPSPLERMPEAALRSECVIMATVGLPHPPQTRWQFRVCLLPCTYRDRPSAVRS